MNPYQSFVATYDRLIRDGAQLPLGGIPVPARPAPAPGAPTVLVFSPHPDDECIFGGLALRLAREAGMRVVNVAVTQGSSKERQQPRLEELRNACNWIGFGLEQTAPSGLEKVNPKTRTGDPAHWAGLVKVIAASLAKHRPRAILFPHDADANSTHMGTHFLVMDALRSMPADFACDLVETEFWGQMATPNLMLELSVDNVSDMLAALSFHVGEVKRNPYHLRLPAWLQDNVRRGAELVGGQGGAAPDFVFAVLYRLREWKNGQASLFYQGGRQIGLKSNPADAFLRK